MRTLEVKAKSYSPLPSPRIGCVCHRSNRADRPLTVRKVFLVAAARPTLDTRIPALEVGTRSSPFIRKRESHMRRAFVLRIAPDFDFDNGKVEGWVEEVDTGRELKFRSVSDLLTFLSKCVKESGKKKETQEGEPS